MFLRDLDSLERINQQESRILELEKAAHLQKQTSNGESGKSSGSEQYGAHPSGHTTLSPSQASTSLSGVDAIELDPPIATLRSIRELAKYETTHESEVARPSRISPFDPVRQGILTAQDAQKAINIFFDNCHPSAPLLNQSTRQSWSERELHSPALVLAICSIGARFWSKGNFLDSARSMHPKFNELTCLLDKAVSRLLLRPTPSDVTLDSIRVLLLYAQWMPCVREQEDEVENDDSAPRFPRSRYNEISAGAVLGLAMRYALLMGLDRSVLAPFQTRDVLPTADHISKMRVYYNLLTCNFNLMLTSGFPASIDFDPEMAVRMARTFSSHNDSQYPGDLRVSGLVELVALVNRTMRTSGDISGRRLGPATLMKLNMELDEWERTWIVRLTPFKEDTPSNHNQMPFNSVRWYRLSLNSASLTPLLSVEAHDPGRLQRDPLLQMLKTSLTSAAQMILSLSIHGARYVWSLDSQDMSTFPDGPYHSDSDSISRLHYTVDSTWISHTFAVTFLVLCYLRGIVDDNLQVCTSDHSTMAHNRLSQFSTSILANILHLAIDVFDSVCSQATFHTARDFQGIVHYASSLVLENDGVDKEDCQEVNDYAFQSLLEVMNDSGVDWAGNLLGGFDDFGDWNIGTL
ncbi:hypothetical protein N7528_002549 [Penicillium herquei]|nr:hypothetical protein N7528_002549 [Penicillium herquei]